MFSQKTLELKGSFQNFPLVEVIVELLQERLSGSLRVTRAEKKSVIYFEDGELVHAVSNARAFRLFSMLLESGKIDQKFLASHPEFTDDIKLSAALSSSGIVTNEQLNELVEGQIRAVVTDALSWPEGQWLFSPLARIRADMKRHVNLSTAMIDQARTLSPAAASQRFKNVAEMFELVPPNGDVATLQPREAFLLSRFDGKPMKFEEVRSVSGLPDADAAHALYALWLGGLVKRSGWTGAFSPSRLEELRQARLSLVSSPKASESSAPSQPETDVKSTTENGTAKEIPEVVLSLPDYLDRVEKAATLYEVLGVSPATKPEAIKQVYFSMAKLFHPDRFHREEPAVLRRIQNAFTELAHAYEVLRTSQSRAAYDLKVKKDQQSKRKAGEKGQVVTDASTAGLESFEQGVECLDRDDYENAAKLLARAVHYAPNNALYHAYFGTALSAAPTLKHKAEAELQTAVKLAPKDGQVRLMLVDFLIRMDLIKRAEGELVRFLEIAPGHTEALRQLEKLRK